MFERVFQWGLRNGSRVLFVAAAAILLIAVWQVFNGLLAGNSTYWSGLAYLFGALSSASFPLFCAVVIERIDLWLQRGGTVAVVSAAPASSWLARWGSHLLLALSLIYFLMTAAICTDLTAVINGSWLGPLWQASLLLFASLTLDRLDRWLATVRPYSD
jgi:hypothetical protein